EDVKGAAQLALLESRREQDAADRAAIEKLFATAFTVNRLKRGVAVSDALPSRASRDQAMAFYQNFYHPENTVVTIVGDIFSLKALGQVQLSFGNFKKAASNQHQQPAPGPGAPKTTAANSKSAPTPATPADNKSINQPGNQSGNQPGNQPGHQPGDQPSGHSTHRNPQPA